MGEKRREAEFRRKQLEDEDDEKNVKIVKAPVKSIMLIVKRLLQLSLNFMNGFVNVVIVTEFCYADFFFICQLFKCLQKLHFLSSTSERKRKETSDEERNYL